MSNDYEPSSWEWVNEQVTRYEASGGKEANTLRDTGLPIVVVTTKGAKTGKLRKSPVIRVEHDGSYAIVASKGGAPENPAWYANIVSHPEAVWIQDGPERKPVVVHEANGDERATWWVRAVAAYPPYAEYQETTSRLIPVIVATPVLS